jgi:putative spermidine/putrescine transport system substrate-binding protein
MRASSTRARLLLGVAAASLLFTACSSSGSKDTTAADTAAAAAETTAAAAASDATAAAAQVDATAAAAADTTVAPAAAETSAPASGNEAATGIKAPDLPMATAVGAGEGELNLVAWAGYTEKAWVDPFTAASGCKVNVKVGNTSDEMVALMQTGDYDGVSASGDATLRLIAAGEVAPVNTDLIPNYADVYPALKGKPWNSVGGKSYGVPHGRGANLLAYNTEKITPAPDSWSIVWDANSPAKGSVTAYDSPIYIADAALYLMSTKPELKITNPYALDDTQLAAALDLLKVQKGLIGEYWSDYTKQIAAFKAGSTTVGTTWQVIANSLLADKAPVAVVLPKEGSTGWSDTWMISAKAKHPNCMYLWMNEIISPKANAAATEFFGEAPANPKACAFTADKNQCTTFHADDEAYFSKIWYWTTPVKDCIDGRGPICTDYAAWTKAWTELKG